MTPYVGAGIGDLFLGSDFGTPVTTLIRNDEVFAYQFIAGDSAPISHRVDLFGEYQFFGSTDTQLSNVGVQPTAQIGNYRAETDNLFFGIHLRR